MFNCILSSNCRFYCFETKINLYKKWLKNKKCAYAGLWYLVKNEYFMLKCSNVLILRCVYVVRWWIVWRWWTYTKKGWIIIYFWSRSWSALNSKRAWSLLRSPWFFTRIWSLLHVSFELNWLHRSATNVYELFSLFSLMPNPILRRWDHFNSRKSMFNHT